MAMHLICILQVEVGRRERESIKTTIDYGRVGKKDWGIEGPTKQLNSAFVVRFAS